MCMERSTRWQTCGANLTCAASLLHPPPILSYPCTIHSTTRGVILADLRVHVIFSTFTCARTYGTFMSTWDITSGRNGYREATHRAGLRSRHQGGWLKDPLGMVPRDAGGEGERCWFLRPILPSYVPYACALRILSRRMRVHTVFISLPLSTGRGDVLHVC